MSEQSDLRKMVEELRSLDEQFNRWRGPGDERPNLYALRHKLLTILYEGMPALLDAAVRCERLEAENWKLADALTNMVICRDTSWDDGEHGGHDWPEALERANAALAAQE